MGDTNRPLSLNRWMYVEGNPVNLTDPTGHFPEWCRSKWTKWGYAKCVLDNYNLEPAGSIFLNGDAVKDVKGSSGCWSGPVHYRAHGYIEGYSWFGTIAWGGTEIVYDFSTMERSEFRYSGIGVNDSVIGGGYAPYAGIVEGLRSDMSLREKYLGLAFIESYGLDIPILLDGLSVGLGGTKATAIQDWKLKAYSIYLGIGGSLGLPYGDVGYGVVDYSLLSRVRTSGTGGRKK